MKQYDNCTGKISHILRLSSRALTENFPGGSTEKKDRKLAKKYRKIAVFSHF